MADRVVSITDLFVAGELIEDNPLDEEVTALRARIANVADVARTWKSRAEKAEAEVERLPALADAVAVAMQGNDYWRRRCSEAETIANHAMTVGLEMIDDLRSTLAVERAVFLARLGAMEERADRLTQRADDIEARLRALLGAASPRP